MVDDEDDEAMLARALALSTEATNDHDEMEDDEEAMLAKALEMSQTDIVAKNDEMDEEEDEETMLAKALALSQQAQNESGSSEDADMKAALELSIQTDDAPLLRLRTKEQLQARVQELFKQFVVTGVVPNDAAAQAMQQAQQEQQAAEAASVAVAFVNPLKEKETFQARVKELFAEEVASGASPNAAAAQALARAQVSIHTGKYTRTHACTHTNGSAANIQKSCCRGWSSCRSDMLCRRRRSPVRLQRLKLQPKQQVCPD